jgi:plastocyanin
MFGAPKTIRLGVLLAVVVLAVSTACGGGEDRPGNVRGSATGSGSASASGSHAHGEAEHEFARGEEDSTVELTLKDFAFEGVPAETKGEKVLFEARVITGEHELEVLDASGKALGEIEPFKTDDGEKTLALKLAPGTYTLQCLVDEGARTHKELGMVATLHVT